jgi:formylglycine-generating enzyme required for sulfatase activity
MPIGLSGSYIIDAASAEKYRVEYSLKNDLPLMYINEMGMKFSLVPAGTFLVGSPFSEANRQKKETPHLVTITKAYYIGVTEITQSEWLQVLVENPSKFLGNNHPVDQVSFEKALEFAQAYSMKGSVRYRLPTEAEWEIACRAGAPTLFGGNGNIDEMGWYCLNSESKTHAVATKKPNQFGIYDMHGNVWEWTSDTSSEYPDGNLIDPKATKAVSGNHVKRGGSYLTSASVCRSAYRHLYVPMVYRQTNTGFRLVFQADQLKQQEISLNQN